ncbi:MAG: TIGR04282 family arsenosugar biosynthesis glycosyltransferase [Acetobacteraceae bacterium]|nr:TIGR04282 family arsenosugar biosynthesis glycosyltransferase [Acetobacteraceae bacterium]
MAKAPKAGHSKTRLSSALSPEAAASLSAAFLRDATENIRLASREASIAGFVAYAPAGQEELFADHVAAGTSLVLADGSPPMPPGVHRLGRSLLHAFQSLLSAGFGAACMVNSDSPNLPTSLLVEGARALLAPGERVVLGPAEDGGYYLLGLRTPHPHLFQNIPWSTPGVAEATRNRAQALGLELIELEPWYDVDDSASLQRLIQELSNGAASRSLTPYRAPATAACLQRFGLSATMAARTAQ